MKKLIALFLALAMLASLAGCAGTTVVVGNCTCPPERHETPAETPDEPAAGVLKTGLAIVPAVGESKSATAEANGTAKYDVTVVAVTVDDNGVIRGCVIDSIGTDVQASAAAGNLTVQTKNEQGDAYGMKAYAGAKYEWYEQAAALAEYAVGKTVEELKNGAVNEAGKAADADLATVATIYLGGYVTAIEKAVAGAQNLGAQSGDELKLSIISSVDVTPGEAGTTIQLNVDAAAVTMAGDVITSCAIDALQAKVEFDAAGVITTDITAAPQTKNELGEAYGMKTYAGAKFEWNEQAANFASYITGKTVAEVAGIAVNEGTKPADGTDLAASVTIAIGGFQALIAKVAE